MVWSSGNSLSKHISLFRYRSINLREREKREREAQRGVMRPARSDAHLPPEEAARIEQETRRYFEQIAPKRHPKPSRSDYDDSSNLLPISDRDSSLPELQRLQDLAANPQRLACEGGGGEVVEEYVETEYYKDLNCIDKQHHTTGTGFIKLEDPAGSGGFDMNPMVSGASAYQPHTYRANPATNDWIPSADPFRISQAGAISEAFP